MEKLVWESNLFTRYAYGRLGNVASKLPVNCQRGIEGGEERKRRPDLPSWVSRTLQPLAAFTNNPTVDTAQLLAERESPGVEFSAMEAHKLSSPSPYRRSTSSGRGRLISFEGRQLYISNAGRTFDISQPPPYNCYGGSHWAIHCTAQNSRRAGRTCSFSTNTPNF